jgi:hypothetical protein
VEISGANCGNGVISKRFDASPVFYGMPFWELRPFSAEGRAGTYPFRAHAQHVIAWAKLSIVGEEGSQPVGN